MQKILFFIYGMSLIGLSFKQYLINFGSFSIAMEASRYFGVIAACWLLLINWKIITRSDIIILLIAILLLTEIAYHEQIENIGAQIEVAKFLLMVGVAALLIGNSSIIEYPSWISLWFMGGFISIALGSLINSEVDIASVYIKIVATLIPGQNYIASSIVGIGLLIIIAKNNRLMPAIVLCIFLAFLMNSRTGVLSLSIPLIYILYRRKFWIFVAIMPLAFIALNYIIINKWESSSIEEAMAGRVQPWLFYVDEVTNSFSDLFPAFISGNNMFGYLGPETGEYHSPHNLIISLILTYGWVLGVALLIILFIVFLRAKDLNMRAALIGVLVHSSLEPVVWFSDNFLTFVFFIIIIGSLYGDIFGCQLKGCKKNEAIDIKNVTLKLQ